MRVPVSLAYGVEDLTIKERSIAAKLGIKGYSHIPADRDIIAVINAYSEARIPAIKREIEKACESAAWRNPGIADVASMMIRLSRSIEAGYSTIVGSADPASDARAHAWACIRSLAECAASSRLASALYRRFWRSRVQDREREETRVPGGTYASKDVARRG